jgi:hypothetical protein
MPFVIDSTVSAPPRSRAAPSPEAALCALDDLVVALEPAQRTAPCRQLLDEAGHGPDEAGHLVDQWRQQQREQPREHQQHDRRRGAAALPTPPLERRDGRISRPRGTPRRESR